MDHTKAEFFDSQVDEPWASSEFEPDETGKIERMLEHARICEGMRVLEPGCGTGRLTAILADLVGPKGYILAVDMSSKMIESARCRIGLQDNVSLEQASIENYCFAPKSFDAVICHNTFPHFDDKPGVVSHLAAGLKRGGRFIVFHFMSSARINDLHRKAHVSVLNDLIPPEAEMRKILQASGLQVDTLIDDESGYLLSSTRT
jgi:ubiquinone/menaquinone biosynthesis C-methylase UbiE